MPFRQSTLNFGFHATASVTRLEGEIHDSSAQSVSGSLMDTDTIVVNTTTTFRQLPTPSESATETSSQSSQAETATDMLRSRSKRVSSTRKRKGVFSIKVETEQDQHRTVSGETLVPDEVTLSRSTLVDQDLNADGDAWKETEVSPLKDANKLDEEDSVITVREDSEDDEAQEERRAAKRAKVEENAKKWEQRRKAAEKNATRRSGRASLLSKASEILDNIKDTVLGKRTRNVDGDVGDHNPAASRLRHAAQSESAPPSKKVRMSEEDHVMDEPGPKKTVLRREKKWLVSGLYAGQPRRFDARLTENKNRGKSKTTEPVHDKENLVIPLPMFAGERLLQHGRDFKLPFDVFSPLSAGQPKPDEWKKVNKNVFVGDAAAEWRTNKYVEHSTCLCTSKKGCDQNCMNRYMYYECDTHNCNVPPAWCGNRPFEGLKHRTKVGGKYNVGVEVIKTADRGYGVRSNRTFEPNQIIVEYTGEIITQEECEHRMRTMYKDNACYYLMLFDQNMIIDATRGSMARFVNHSCEPNCRMEKWTVGGKPRMALFAGDRGILTGEELTYDYNFDPYSQKNVQECRCGANNCRGVLGPKPKPEAKRISPEDDQTKKKEGKPASAKAKMATMSAKGTKTAVKKRVVSLSSKKNRPLSKTQSKDKSPKRKVLVKKSSTMKSGKPQATTKLSRSDSKLKKMLKGAKAKAGSAKGRRVASSSSATEALLGKKKVATVSRTSSLKAKAKSISRSVRGKGKTIVVAS